MESVKKNDTSISLQAFSSPSVQYYKSIFDGVDSNHDGYITINELRDMITNESLTDKHLTALLAHKISDINNDGLLDFTEFVNMINNPHLQSIFGKYVTTYVKFIVPRERGNVPSIHEDVSYDDEYTCCPPPFGMIIISIIELIFFFIDKSTQKDSTTMGTGSVAEIFLYDPKKKSEFWRFLTYMFVHASYVHLGVNLIFQILLGIPLEMVHKWWRVLIIYFTGVIAASLCTSVIDPTSRLAGASGGVLSLSTAHIATIILNWSEMTFPLVQLLIILPILGVDIGMFFYNIYCDETDNQIAYEAHFAGILAGLMVGIFVLRNLKLTKRENVVWWIALGLYIILMVVGILWNIF